MTKSLPYTLPADSLPVSELKQQMSYAYLHMVVSAAGCHLLDPKADYDGVDVLVQSSCDYVEMPLPAFDVQLKCTSQQIRRGGHLSWPLEKKKYMKLSGRRSRPAFICVLVVPERPEIWLKHSEKDLLTESVMYWKFGRELPPFNDAQGTQTVALSPDNKMTAETVLEIMAEIGKGGYRAY